MFKSFNTQRKILSWLLSLAMILTALPLAGVTAFAEDETHTSGNFEYAVLEDGTAEITGYTGSDETLEIPSKLDTYTVTSIGYDAFAYHDNLISVTIPDSVTSIGKEAFWYCVSLTEIKVDANNKNYSSKDGVLFDKNKTELIQYPAGIAKEKYDVPNSVTSIGFYAFAYCAGLTSVTIPNSVISIGDYAFEYCDSLTEINVDTNNKNYSSQDGVLFNKNKTELIYCPEGKTGEYNIPDSVTSIGKNAFENCDLTSVTIPNSITSIGNWAFARCYGLTSITIPESVTSIGDWAFYNCDSLTSVTIDNGVTSIGSQAFYGCYNLTNITIPDSVTSIGSGAFDESGCYNNPSNWKNGVLYIDNCLIKANNDEILENCEINEGTRVIATSAFSDCDSLTSVTIPDSVTSIGDGAFNGCDSLTSITIPDSVIDIGGSAFLNTGYYNNPSNWENGVLYIDNCLVGTIYYEVPENYTINEGTRVIAERAFFWCIGLTSVTIPDSVTSIGAGPFPDCNSLTEINVDANNKNYSSQDGVLFDKNKTELIQYPAGKPETSYDIPNSVTSIGDYAFAYCDSLASVTIPDSVTIIGDSAFDSCYSLTDIYILNKDCNIVSSSEDYYYTIPTETTIHGYAGSTAESYAEEHGNKFVEICNHLNIEKVPAKAVTCTEDGNIEYYHCSDCNKNFKDINGNEEVTDIVVKATGHKMGEKVAAKAATCTEDGNIEYYHCSDCNKNFKDINGNEEVTDVVVKATGHNMAQVPAKAATCTEDGSIEYYHCSACNKNFKDKDGKEEVTDVAVKATGHKYEDGVCTVCGAKEPVNPSDPTNPVNPVDPVNPDTPKANGDVNNDGKLSIVDAKWILQYIAGSKDFSDKQFKTADLNGDGKLSIVDAKWVLQAVAGMRTV